MALLKREKSTIMCPRCGMRSLKGTESCPDCGLVFSRLELATNKDAKKKILQRDKDFVIYTSSLPQDVKFIKLLLMAIFLGIFGGHCFYVGRYWRGGMFLVNGLVLLCCTIFNDYLIKIDGGKLIATLATIGGLILCVWAYDIVMIVLKKFKVPVTINLEGEDK